MFELTKSFRFEAAHTLNRIVDQDASRRIHGHSYRAVVALRGTPNEHGMLLDLGLLERHLAATRDALDHRLLDDVPNLGPATLENLSRYVWNALAPLVPTLAWISIHRDSQDESCTYTGPTP